MQGDDECEHPIVDLETKPLTGLKNVVSNAHWFRCVICRRSAVIFERVADLKA